MTAPIGKTVILVNGVPASGKSTVAHSLAQRLTLPYLALDSIKEPFMLSMNNVDRGLNRLLGCAAYQAIWSIVGMAPVGCTYVVDAWFGFQPKETLCQYLRQAGVIQVFEVWNQISGELAAERYAKRLDDRLPGHPGAEYLAELRILATHAKPMAFGPVFTVQQPQPVDMNALTHWLARHAYPIKQHA